MVQRRGRPLKGFDDGSSSEEEEDAFATISKKKKPRLAALLGGESDKPASAPSEDDNNKKEEDASASSTLPIGETSSNKRHHHTNAARQAKMDALLQELKTAKPSESSRERGGGDRDDYKYGSIYDGEGEGYNGYDRFAPMKKGSYVEPGMEHLTTNLFVGNLDPMTTEEELTDTFRQFGDLYSVKIMWPRTAEERARNRNTGFVCFMHRADAEDAMDELCDADPLGVGRRMVLRWGKNVKKTVKFGTGGVPTNLRKLGGTKKAHKRPTNASRDPMEISAEKPDDKSDRAFDDTEPATKYQNSDHQHIPTTTTEQPQSAHAAAEVKTKQKPVGPIYDPVQHSAEAIIVNAPRDPRRLAFINTVASFVAKDGSIFEQKLIETQAFNQDFAFLTVRGDDTVSLGSADDEERIAEHIFYRWRVYSFAQGDGNNSWNTIPFVMFKPHGRFWVPPPLNTAAAEEEEEAEKRREDNQQAAQEERRKLAGQKQDCMKTGAQLRRENLDKGAAARLNDWERKVFHEFLREKLCASRESICEAMAFAFDKSGAAHEISELLKEALVESGNGISVDTRIARLFLLSDILFNSQQPGVRNAFHYRDAIEDMSPDVFESLGKHGGGRMTKNKLRRAVSSVLGAWVNWSVYNSNFIDELESKFEGREIKTSIKVNDVLDQEDQDESQPDALGIDETNQEDADGDDNLQAVSTTPRGTWTSAENLKLQTNEQDVDGESLDGDIDGEELDDIDGEPLDDDDIDGEELDDMDGEALDNEE